MCVCLIALIFVRIIIFPVQYFKKKEKTIIFLLIFLVQDKEKTKTKTLTYFYQATDISLVNFPPSE